MEKYIRYDQNKKNWTVFILGIIINVIVRSTEPEMPSYTTYALTGGAIFLMLKFTHDMFEPMIRYYRRRVSYIVSRKLRSLSKPTIARA